jgi:hypothetical protein
VVAIQKLSSPDVSPRPIPSASAVNTTLRPCRSWLIYPSQRRWLSRRITTIEAKHYGLHHNSFGRWVLAALFRI